MPEIKFEPIDAVLRATLLELAPLQGRQGYRFQIDPKDGTGHYGMAEVFELGVNARKLPLFEMGGNFLSGEGPEVIDFQRVLSEKGYLLPVYHPFVLAKLVTGIGEYCNAQRV